MTPDETETRITRLETRLLALTALVHCVLPATVPTARNQVLKQLRRYCSATEAQIFQDDPPKWLADWHLQELATMYTGLEGALQLIDAYEAKQR